MIRFLALRLGRAAVTIVLVVTFAFVVLRLSGDPAMLILNVDAPAEAIAAFRRAWGLDRPVCVQYVAYFGNILHGDLGQSMRDGRPAAAVVWERLPATLMLTVPALMLKIGVGVPAGIQAALHRGSLTDRVVMAAAVAGFTVPSFVLGLVLVLVFAVQLGWLPSGGQDSWLSPVLPVITLGVGGAAILARFTPQRHAGGAGPTLYPHRDGEGSALARRGARPCAAQRGHPYRHDRGLHGRQPAGGRGRGRERVQLARRRPPAGGRGVEPGPGRRAVHPAAGGVHDGDGELRRRSAVRVARSAAAGRTLMSGAAIPLAPVRDSPPLPLLTIAALAWVALMLAAAVFADWLRPYGITQLDLRNRLAPPLGFGGVAAHPLGTDELGRDVLSRLLVSIRISLLIAFGATAIAGVLGTTLGFLAAQFRGWVEQAVLMLIDFQAALPFLILALAVLAFFGNALPLFVALMGLYGWERHARIARGLAIAADAQGYASAVRQLGAGPFRVYLRHVLPNIASTLIVSATLSFPEVILLESGLSFLGLGIQPPMTSLGNMIGYGREYLTRAPWILLAPSAVVVLTTFSVSVLGDWLRDRLDPTLR